MGSTDGGAGVRRVSRGGEFQGFRFHRVVQSGLAAVHLLSLRFISDVRLAVSKEQREKSPKPAPEAMSRAGLV